MAVEFHLRSAADLGVPTNTSGSTRPLMQMNRPWHTVHYTGIRPDQIWFSGGDGVFDNIEDVYRFLRRLEEVARGSGKPFEYNTVIPVMADGSAHVLAYADEYVAAHSAGENALAHGTLIAAGVGQDINDGTILAFRWWNAILRASGRLSVNSTITPHGEMPDAGTPCPGIKIINRLPELRVPYVEEAPPLTDSEIEEIMNALVALIILPPKDGSAGPNPPWLIHIDGSTTYIGTAAYKQLVAKGVPVEEHNLDQYSHYRKAAGL